MTRPRVAVRLSTLVFALVPLACGMRGPPLPPLVIVPAQVSDLSAERFGNDVHLQLTIPSANADRSEPADLDRVEVYALTTQPADDQPRVDNEEWLELATLVATFEVERAETDDERQSPDDGPRYAQGDEIALVETLTPETRVPVELVDADEVDQVEEPVETEGAEHAYPPPVPFVSPPLPQPARRTYVAQAVSTRGRESRPSAKVAVPLGSAPDPPGAVTMTYTADSISIVWEPPATARLPLQTQQLEAVLPSTTLLPPQMPSRYEVYDLSVPAPDVDPEAEADPEATPEIVAEDQAEAEALGIERPTAVNGSPLAVASYAAAVPSFGVERCFAIRTIDVVDPVDELVVRSPPSETACVMVIDTFPPTPPTDLVAVSTEGAISLTWSGSTGGGVEGYVVLRGDASGATLDPLLTEPVTATNYRDTTVEAGQTYAYAVQAIDGATPPNLSAPSVSVVEQAR